MSRRVKQLLSRGFRSNFEDALGALIVDLTGLDAIATHELRGELKAKSIRLQVIRNRLAKRAFAGHSLEPLAKHFVGPCALAIGESTVDVAREFAQLAKKYPAIEVKHGLVEGADQCIGGLRAHNQEAPVEQKTGHAGQAAGANLRFP